MTESDDPGRNVVRDTAEEDQERRVRRSEFATRLAVILFAIYALGSTGVIVVLAVQDHHRIKQNDSIQQFIKDQSIENGKIGETNQQLAETIRDCTTPEGECYKRGQEATATAVGDINRVVILAAACASGVDRDLTIAERQSEIQQCVIEGLASTQP